MLDQGAGPAGLFAALALVDAGMRPVIVERGKPVEQRGRSIGALFNRGLLDPEASESSTDSCRSGCICTCSLPINPQ